MEIYLIPSFIVDTPGVKQSRLRALRAELWRVKSWKFPLVMFRGLSAKNQVFVFGLSDDLPLLFLSSSLIHTQLARLLLHSSSYPPLPASSSSSSAPLSSTHTLALFVRAHIVIFGNRGLLQYLKLTFHGSYFDKQHVYDVRHQKQRHDLTCITSCILLA